jgi:carbamate kinase
MAEAHFAPGSMLPKIEAAAEFTAKPGRRTLICSPENLATAWRGEAGTWVLSDP